MAGTASAAEAAANLSVSQKLGVGLALAAMALLLLVIVVEHARRHKAEIDARRSKATVMHMNRVGIFDELTGAIAHEVNTPLAAIVNDARAALHFLENPASGLRNARECMAAILINAQRAHDVILRMRNAMRREVGARSRWDLSSVVRDSAQLLQREANERGAKLELLLASQPLQVDGDAIQVQQVVLNLLLNAVEACAEQPAERRRVVVRTQGSGNSAEVLVMDRGCGVPAKDRAHLFEAFYTTKSSGLGMGLSISRSIAESHGGRLLMEPAEGVGSVFRLVLPLSGRRPTVARGNGAPTDAVVR